MEDYFGMPLKIGDRVIFPIAGEMMEGTITKIDESQFLKVVSVKNDSGYIKKKAPLNLVNCSYIRDAFPEIQL